MRNRVQVKICGITRRDDAENAIELGADAIGLVFAESPRKVSLEQAAAITQGLKRSALKIGVFVNPEMSELEAAVSRAELTGIQLHGSESEAFVRTVKNRFQNLVILKAMEPENLSRAMSYSCDMVLVDPSRDQGKRIPLVLAATQLRERLDELRSSSVPFYIAGGIHADNVSELVMTLQPQGVDLSSGVELSPGIKDREKMIRFFEAMERVHL